MQPEQHWDLTQRGHGGLYHVTDKHVNYMRLTFYLPRYEPLTGVGDACWSILAFFNLGGDVSGLPLAAAFLAGLLVSGEVELIPACSS